MSIKSKNIFTHDVSKRILDVLKIKDISRYKLAQITGMTEAGISTAINNHNNWSLDSLMKIAKYLHVSLDWLVYGGEKNMELVTEAFKRNNTKLPILGLADCGLPSAQWESATKKFLELPDMSMYKDAFVLIAKGDSMSPYINKGDYLVGADLPDRIKDRTAVITVFRTVDYAEANAKMYRYDRTHDLINLYPINTKHDPINIPHSEYSEHIVKMYKLIRIVRDVT